MSKQPLSTRDKVWTGCVVAGGIIRWLIIESMTGGIGYELDGVPGAVIGALVPPGVLAGGALLAHALGVSGGPVD